MPKSLRYKKFDLQPTIFAMNKLVFSILLLGVFFNSQASHEGGGEIFYEFVSDLGNGQTRYKVSVILYHNDPTPPMDVHLSYSSSCDPGSSLWINLVPGYNVTYQDCLDTTLYKPYLYQTHINLPKRCADWVFGWQSNCCLPMNVNNLQNVGGIGSSGSAHLNNLQGDNDSPMYIDPYSRGFCVSNNNYVWKQRAIDFEGDSLAYRILDFPFNTWAPGHSQNNPFGSPNGMLIDSSRGLYSFQVANAGLYILRLQVDEYRRDTANASWHRVGSTSRLMSIPVYQGCDSTLTNWSINTDSLNQKKDLMVSCGTNVLEMSVSKGFQCSSLVPTDFSLYDSIGAIIPIIKAEGNCTFGTADSLYFELHHPLNKNGTYYLVSRTGNDGNTIVSACGFGLSAFDTTLVIVNDCSGIGLNEFDQMSNVNLYPNPFENKFIVDLGDYYEKVSVEIRDNAGHLISRIEHTEVNEVDVELALAKGLYFVTVRISDNEFRIFKMLKSL